MCPILKINESTKSFVPCNQNQAQTTNIQKTLYGQLLKLLYLYIVTFSPRFYCSSQILLLSFGLHKQRRLCDGAFGKENIPELFTKRKNPVDVRVHHKSSKS